MYSVRCIAMVLSGDDMEGRGIWSDHTFSEGLLASFPRIIDMVLAEGGGNL